jgi:hypothetical protein
MAVLQVPAQGESAAFGHHSANLFDRRTENLMHM